MGKSQKQWREDAWKGHQGQQGQHGRWPSYGPSSSTWSETKGKGKQKGGKQPWHQWHKEVGAFPAFDEMTSEEQSGQTETTVEAEARGGTGGAMRIMQKLINGVRRSEARLRKLEAEETEVDAKWKTFQDGLKKAFITERARFMERKEKIAKDRAEQQETQVEAIQELQEFLLDPMAVRENQDKKNDSDMNAEALGAWDELMQDAEGSDTHGLSNLLSGAMATGGALRRRAREQMLEALAQHRAAATGPVEAHTPQRRGARTLPITPPAVTRRQDAPTPATPTDGEIASMLGEAAIRDPYLASPSTSALPEVRVRSRPRSQQPRKAIKQQGKEPPPTECGGTSLADKLDARRGAALAKETVLLEDDEEDALLSDLKDGQDLGVE